MGGIVEAVHKSASHTLIKPGQASIRLLAGLGVEGDAHMGVTVKHRSRVARDPSQPNLRQVHLIHAELHDELRAHGFTVGAGAMGENITTRGVDLLHLLEDLRPRLLDLTGTLQDFLVQAQQDIAATGDRAGRTLERLDSAVAENNTALKRLMRELHVNLGEVNKTMLAAQKTLTTTTTALETTQGNTTRLLVTVRDLSENLQRSTAETLAGLQRLLAHADEMIRHNDRNLYHSLESLRDTAENLQAATRQVRTNPSVLLWGNSQPEPEARSAADATTRTLQDRGRVGRYDRLQ